MEESLVHHIAEERKDNRAPCDQSLVVENQSQQRHDCRFVQTFDPRVNEQEQAIL